MLKPKKTDIETYLKGKKWYWYLPGWLFGLYLFIQLLQFSPEKRMPFIVQIPQAFDFFLHEMSHIILSFLPAILTASAGSLSEIFLGTVLVLFAYRSRNYFTGLICSMWFMLACQSAGIYMADARTQNMSLVSLGGALSGSDTVTHDWHFVFGKLHLLPFDTIIGGTVRLIGGLVGLSALIFTAWLLYKMAAKKPA